ncbi:solute carrier family 22 member 3 [Rousettus aegyptiacus]|uniref:Solute carrier family 22 member 3 n=1 Tax=Rousettus aegyptiacus TaxID=9407 RepID=A0A7J8KGQ5_ROUAE|nr:solute carrier family 22 member 3 [Rousettus aegyptiacus]KAF6508034.1 solute carrier family 22 member 3 [Rousettus aegyptiacus]
MPSFDEALQRAGEFGRFQRRVFLLLCLTGVTFAFLFVAVVFLGSRPDRYWCRGPGAAALAERCGWSAEEEWNRTAPERHGHGRCQRFLLEAANATAPAPAPAPATATAPAPATAAAAAAGLSCADPLAAFPNRSAPLVPCAGAWRYAQAHSTIVSEFDLVCVNAWMLDLTQAILNLGFLAGAFTLGYAADRYGRIVIYLISCFGVGVAGVVVAFAPNFPVFVVFRFLQGVFGKGTWMTAYVIVTEIVGSKQRRIVGIVIQMFFTLGIIILPGIAYFIPNWQGIQLAITLPNFLFLLYYWVVPESPRWLITRKEGDKALKILRSIAKCNGKYLSPNYSEITVTDEEVSNPSFLDLVRTPQMRKCTLILMFAWFTSAVVYQGLVMRLGIVGGNLYVDFFISGVVELPGALLILLTIDRFGRRLPFAASNVVAGVACLVTAFLPEGLPWLRATVATLGRLGITMAFEIVYLVNSELYPTTLRNFGVSLCSGLCDFGGIIAPFLLFRLAAVWMELPLIIFGVLASVCGGLVMLLPETKGIVLPETVDDVEKLGRKKKTPVSSSYL